MCVPIDSKLAISAYMLTEGHKPSAQVADVKFSTKEIKRYVLDINHKTNALPAFTLDALERTFSETCVDRNKKKVKLFSVDESGDYAINPELLEDASDRNQRAIEVVVCALRPAIRGRIPNLAWLVLNPARQLPI
jgi:hypothetical protein